MQAIKVRCTQGLLVIDDNTICVQLGQIRERSLARSALTSVDSQVGVPSLFGLGGGEILEANLVKLSVAREIVSLLKK